MDIYPDTTNNNQLASKTAGPKRLSEEPHPEYEYAVSEYHQTVRPRLSNDDGMTALHENLNINDNMNTRTPISFNQFHHQQQIQQHDNNGIVRRRPVAPQHDITAPSSLSATPNRSNVLSLPVTSPQSHLQQHHHQQSQSDSHPPPHIPNSSPESNFRLNQILSEDEEASTVYDTQNYYRHHHALSGARNVPVPDTTYEEQYGDAYVGAPIKYIYPSGYQSMRPRGGPWKLSIAICILFTWLSIFIVGHCSDRVDPSQYQQDIDDDIVVIETRWCGSRLLYFLWVMSMLLTGLSMAYCSVIGYIKMRDFAVANSRSQPPGLLGPSDYYVHIGEVSGKRRENGTLLSSQQGQQQQQQPSPTIYQADGTPQFWGGHIYRPTQAAVAVTSR